MKSLSHSHKHHKSMHELVKYNRSGSKQKEDASLLLHGRNRALLDDSNKDSIFDIKRESRNPHQRSIYNYSVKETDKESFYSFKQSLPPIKDARWNAHNLMQASDGVYITQLRDKGDKSISLSYKRRRDEAMYSKIAQVPIFNEFKQDIEDYEHTRGFLSKYLNAQTRYLNLDQFIQKVENLKDILDPIEKQKQSLDLSYEGFGPKDLFINVLFSIFGKILSAIKTFEASCEERTDLDDTIIKKARTCIAQLNEKLSSTESSEESLVSLKKLCNLYQKSTKIRDENVLNSYTEISVKSREEILGNNEVDRDNLLKHKKLLNSLSLKLEKLEEENLRMNKQLSDQEDMIFNFFYNCKSVIKKTDLMHSIQHVKIEPGFDSRTIEREFYRTVDLYHKVPDKYDRKAITQNMLKDSKSELFFMAIKDALAQSVDKKTKCELQTVMTLERMTELEDKHARLNSQFEKLKEAQANTQKKLLEKSQEMQRLRAKLNHEFNHAPLVEQGVQTLVDCKNVPFTVAAEKILEAKLASKLKPIMSIIQKVEENKIDEYPMLKNTVVDFMHSAYVKKAEDVSIKDKSSNNFEDILYSVFEQRFIFKKKIKKKCQQFLIGLREYGENDERMDDFKKFIGFDQPNKYPHEILELYVKTMKCTDESFAILLSDEAENLSLGIEKAYKDILEVFNNAPKLMKQDILISMIYDSNFYCDGKLQPSTKEYQRIRKFILNKVRNDEEGVFEFNKIDVFLPEIIKEDLIEGTLQNYLYKDTKNFLRQTHELRIPIRKFMSIGLKTAIRFYESAKNYYQKIFESCDTNCDGYIDYQEFTNMINKIDPDRPRWKVIAIFEMTAGLHDNGNDYNNMFTEDVKINFNQFLESALSHSLMSQMIDR